MRLERNQALIDERVRDLVHAVALERLDGEAIDASVGNVRRRAFFRVNQGKVSCATALIKAGADLEAECEPRRRTPLILAIENMRYGANSLRIIPILLRAGARLDMNRINHPSIP